MRTSSSSAEKELHAFIEPETPLLSSSSKLASRFWNAMSFCCSDAPSPALSSRMSLGKVRMTKDALPYSELK